MIITAVIVDDEFSARAELRAILEERGDVDIVGECEDGDEVVKMIQERNPDVIYLDIQMRNRNGLVAAGEILEMVYPPSIVFTTGFNQFAAKAFELNAVDYILKPYSFARVNKSADKLLNIKTALSMQASRAESAKTNKTGPANLCVWSRDRMRVLRPSEIFFAKADENRQTLLQTEQGAVFTKLTLRDLEGVLTQQGFLRTHKSYLVNLSKVREVIPWFNNTYVLSLENCSETNIPVARHYIKEFNIAMGII